MLTSGNNASLLNTFSGSTVCTVLFNGTKVYCANAGDSRAIKVGFNSQDQGSLNRISNSLFPLPNFRILPRSFSP